MSYDAVDGRTQQVENEQEHRYTEEDGENTQRFTQETYDPRRSGQANSGLREADHSDVICILHPSSPAAFRVVAATALANPQHILQNQDLVPPDPDSQASITEQDTMLLESLNTDQAKDLALRFSSRVNNPAKGFCFGRNPISCDVVLEMGEQSKRLSNTHFRIFINSSGVVMLEDLSTNGTMVDDRLLKSKAPGHERARMLNQGSVIRILSAIKDETIKFLVRYPPRHGHTDEYTSKFQDYMANASNAEKRALATKQGPPMPAAAIRGHLAAPLIGPPNPKNIAARPFMVNSNFGMHWDGGDKYRPVGLLGKGAFAIVYQLSDISTGECYAAKELEKKRFMKNGILDLKIDNEMRIMQSLRHPNIVQYIDYKEEPEHLYIIMEYVQGGDLQGYMHAHGTLSEPLAKEMTCQVLGSLAYLHQKNITHRDIKPDNILIATEDPFVVKLTDFGLSKVVSDGDTMLRTFCGTLLYCAPEVFPHYDNYISGSGSKRRRREPHSKRRSYNQSVDIWSYAAVLWFVLCGSPPIEGVVDQTGKAMFTKIMETHLDTQPLRDHGVSNEAVDLLLKMLNTDPTARPSEKQCLRHPWLSGGILLEIEADQNELLPIAEEEEADGENLDASQLSIHDESDDEDKDPGSNGDGSDLADLRQSKRHKVNEVTQVRDGGRLYTSSEFSSVASFPVPRNLVPNRTEPPTPTKPNLLFGEINQAASGVLGTHPDHSLISNQDYAEMNGDSTHNEDRGNQRINTTIPSLTTDTPQIHPQSGVHSDASLLGAESLVRELHMESPNASRTEHTPKQVTPKATAGSFNPYISSPDRSLAHLDNDKDTTPKQPVYNRQISLPISASLFFDADSLHPAQEASEESSNKPYPQGVVFTEGSPPSPSNTHPERLSQATFQPLPETEFASYRSSAPLHQHEYQKTSSANPHEREKGPVAIENTRQNLQSQVLGKMPRIFSPHLGHLSSTSGSFVSLNIPLTERITSWGRNPNNTHVYVDSHDTRVPKCALELWFHARGIERADAAGLDWRTLPGLHTVIRAQSSRGLWINGARLPERDEKGRSFYGRVHTGDIIAVSWGTDADVLEFHLVIEHGEGSRRRSEGEKFRLEAYDDHEANSSASTSAGANDGLGGCFKPSSGVVV